MDFSNLLHTAGKFLQFVGLLLSSAAILGEKRLKSFEILNRKFRRIINLQFFLRVIKPVFSMLLLVGFSIAIIIAYPYLFLTTKPSAFEALGLAGGLFMAFAFVLAMLMYLGMVYISVSSISSNSLSNHVKSEVQRLRLQTQSTPWIKNVSQSWLYTLFHYTIYLFVYYSLISPLQAMSLALEGKGVAEIFRNRLESYENNFLPSYIKKSNRRWLSIFRETFSLNSYNNALPFSNSRWLAVFPLHIIFYPVYVLLMIYLWFGYFYFLVAQFLAIILFGLIFFVFYLSLWMFINTSVIFVSAFLYVLLVPYKALEIFRIKAKLQGGSLVILGIVLGLIGILMD